MLRTQTTLIQRKHVKHLLQAALRSGLPPATDTVRVFTHNDRTMSSIPGTGLYHYTDFTGSPISCTAPDIVEDLRSHKNGIFRRGAAFVPRNAVLDGALHEVVFPSHPEDSAIVFVGSLGDLGLVIEMFEDVEHQCWSQVGTLVQPWETKVEYKAPEPYEGSMAMRTPVRKRKTFEHWTQQEALEERINLYIPMMFETLGTVMGYPLFQDRFK